MRSPEDICESCNFISLEPENFEAAVTPKGWVESMKLNVIEENDMVSLVIENKIPAGVKMGL